MLRKISIILFVLFVFGIIFVGFFLLKNEQPKAIPGEGGPARPDAKPGIGVSPISRP